MDTFTTNSQLELAYNFVQYTNQNIFLTGKAGTGKTTFLHRIKKESFKRSVVVAPTGVAAINAGGMTIHSFFQLPFGPYLPGNFTKDANSQRRFNRQKINLIKSLDLLIIDEISMVRSDVLDGIDDVLRRYRDYSKPFGGVQLLMIGDLHQLPPVVSNEEKNMLSPYYDQHYFFGSRALQKTNLVTVVLKHIFRQSDEFFIRLLNRVRENQMDNEVLDLLNSRFIPDFKPKEEDAYIILTTHNYSAQQINKEKLDSLSTPIHTFKAEKKGEFPENALPTEFSLELRKGAQVMFIKNDLNPEKRFYNGKIGQITKIEEGQIWVKCPKETDLISVPRMDWRNVKYHLNEETKEITEEELGVFTQLPLKLAWAITIHKSQGLTFERAVIDAQLAFDHGQVYVALSRCKSFEGIVLRSKINFGSVKTDIVVQDYSMEAEKKAPDEAHLQQSKKEYQETIIRELFGFKDAKRGFDLVRRVFLEHENTLTKAAFQQFNELAIKTKGEIFDNSDKFQPQLTNYFLQSELPDDNQDLQQRIKKAATYFANKLSIEILPEIKKIPILTDNKVIKKTATEHLQNLEKELFVKKACFQFAQNNFSTLQYLKVKADAEIDFTKPELNPLPKNVGAGVPKTSPHPELYTRLINWREEIASEMKTTAYEILPARSILELTQYLPLDASGLKEIKGIGNIKIRQFGVFIIEIIEKYCKDKGIAGNLMTTAEPVKPIKPDTKLVSFELFKSGKNIAEIAEERGFAKVTIEGHLCHFIGLDQLDIHSVMEKVKVEEIEKILGTLTENPIAEAKVYFGEKYSYGELKMVAEYMKKQQGV